MNLPKREVDSMLSLIEQNSGSAILNDQNHIQHKVTTAQYGIGIMTLDPLPRFVDKP